VLRPRRKLVGAAVNSTLTLGSGSRRSLVRLRHPQNRSRVQQAPWLYLVATGAALTGFALYPLFVLFRMSVSDVGPTNLLSGWNLIGTQNFTDILATADFWMSLNRTFGLTAALLISSLGIAFFCASMLLTASRSTNIVLGVMVFCWAMPPIVTSSVWKFLLDNDGLFNSVLKAVGLPLVGWLSSPDLAIWSVAIVLAWAGLPFSVMVIRGAMLAISPEITEAAAIDGAGFWRTQFSIVFPQLRPTLWILAVLTVLYGFKSFDFIYVLTKGGPGTTSSTLPVLAYFSAFNGFNWSIGAAIAVLTIIVVAIVAIPYMRSVRKEVVE